MPNPIAAPGGAYQINPTPGQESKLTRQPPAGKYTTFPELLEGKLPKHLQVDQDLVSIVQEPEKGTATWTSEMMDQAQGVLPNLPAGPEGFFLPPNKGELLDLA